MSDEDPRKISFFISGTPSPGGSKKAFAHRTTGRIIVVDDAKRNKPWRDSVAAAALDAYSGPLLDSPLEIHVTFFAVRPIGHHGTGRNARTLKSSAPPFPAKKPDATKLLRALEDALTGVLWRDDALIVDQHVFKRWAEDGRPGARVEVIKKCS